MTASLVMGLILAHFVGDYLLQSHWMATQKTLRWWPAIVHGFFYTLPFLPILLVFYEGSWGLLVAPALIIGGTHVLIDHYRWAKHIGWLKNQIGPKSSRPGYEEAIANGGYNAQTPAWLANFLMFVTDNTVHMIINVAASMMWVWLGVFP